MLLGFFYELRQRKVPVGLQEWLTLMQGIAIGLHQSSLSTFYQLARSLLIHTEAHFDAFDQAFSSYFKGIESESLQIGQDLQAWLNDPALLRYLSPEEREALKHLDLDELRKLLAQRMQEQTERHDGGNRWIGTGGTSPFGHSGYHPTGVRIGGPGGGRSAAQIAEQRRYRAYRHDLTLDIRQTQLALRRLRDLRRDGQQNELDVDRTVDKTCRNAGDLELIWRAPRRNNVKVILLMDVGGSMDPHARVMSQLFSAANATKHFRDFAAFYFHNCVYEHVFRDAWFREGISIADLMQHYGPQYKLILVGDALMHPMELLDAGGIIDYYQHNRTPGVEWLRRLSNHFERSVWLNPEPPPYWEHITVKTIRGLFPMFPLTIEGLQEAVAALTKSRPVRAIDLL